MRSKKRPTDVTTPSFTLYGIAGGVVCAGAWLRNFSLAPFILFLLAAGGVVLCVSIVLRTLGKDNALTRQLCPAEAVTGCNEVLDHGQLWKGVTWGDMGLIYFSAQGLYLLMGAATGNVAGSFSLLTVPALLDLPLTIGLLVYQGFFIRQWCKLCLSVTAILWLQAGALLAYATPMRIDYAATMTFALCTVFALLWLLIKPLRVKADENTKLQKQFTRFRRTPAIFNSLLTQQRVIQPLGSPGADVVLGNPAAPHQFISVINPYCRACAAEFPRWNTLLTGFPDTVCLTLYFYVPAYDKPTQKTMAARALLDAYFANPDPERQRLLFKDWFHIRNLGKWSAIWAAETSLADDRLLREQTAWCRANNISGTPMHFLNGYELPEPYRVSDLPFLLSPERITSSQTMST